MTKGKYIGNFTKEELKALEADRQEEIKELQAKKLKDSKRRQKRNNRHVDWSEPTED